MTDSEQNAYADMMAMLDYIHRMMAAGEFTVDADSAGLDEEIGALLAQAHAARKDS